MAGNKLRGERLALTEMVRGDRAATRRHLAQLLLEEAGKVARVARRVGCSRSYLWTVIYGLGMRGEPGAAKRAARERFRLRAA
jgi:transposase-like protein